MSVTAVIPARGGSKRIPLKNTTLLAGVPLIAWTLDAARKSAIIEHIIVSTNDKEVAGIAKVFDVEIIDRPAELCTDTASSEDAVKHALQNSTTDIPDYVFMLQCTAPFRVPGVLDKAVQHLVSSGADSLFMSLPLGRWIWNDDNTHITYDPFSRIMTQQKKWELIEGSDYLTRTSTFLETGCRLGGKITHLDVPRIHGIDIDTPFDLKVAEALAQAEVYKDESMA
jgi:N-acylneuraminate cytidylyltransferase